MTWSTKYTMCHTGYKNTISTAIRVIFAIRYHDNEWQRNAEKSLRKLDLLDLFVGSYNGFLFSNIINCNSPVMKAF